jgi:hypothetical protein
MHDKSSKYTAPTPRYANKHNPNPNLNLMPIYATNRPNQPI